MYSHVFDIWDSKEKKLYKKLDQQALALRASLLSRADCYLIHHIGQKAHNGRDMRHGDILNQVVDNEKYIVAWDNGEYVLRNRYGQKALFMSEKYEVIDNKFEQI